jgi:hypothetical protein
VAGRRVEHSIVKYVARMMGRSTPFAVLGRLDGRLGRETACTRATRRVPAADADR